MNIRYLLTRIIDYVLPRDEFIDSIREGFRNNPAQRPRSIKIMYTPVEYFQDNVKR